ncbi:MAG: hypothetical protein ACRDS9_14490, partial [Pseudonocardiaceae bacterium]
MTLPVHNSDGSYLTVFFDPTIDAWCFTGVDAGPAGAVSVLLDDDVRFSVDAADPAQIVEIAVRTESEGRSAPAAVELIRTLLGDSAAEFVATADPSIGAGALIEIEIEAGAAIRSAAAGLAVARAAMSHRRLAHRLRGLDVVLHAHRIGHPSPAVDAIRASWEVWPAAVALACACRAYSPMLTAVPDHALSALRSRLLVVLHLIAQDDPSVKQSLAYRLVDDLAKRAVATPPDVLAHVDLDAAFAALGLTAMDVDSYPILEPGAGNERVYKGRTVAPRPMHWSGNVEDFTARLGAELQLLHPGGITAHGEAPGELRVTVPVALGVQTTDLRNVRVCAVTEAGHLLGESTLAVGRDPSSLPVGVARLVLPETADGQRYQRVIIDLARQEIPAPDAEELDRLDRLRAIRAGQEAI